MTAPLHIAVGDGQVSPAQVTAWRRLWRRLGLEVIEGVSR
jgi:hypothetical protein